MRILHGEGHLSNSYAVEWNDNMIASNAHNREWNIVGIVLFLFTQGIQMRSCATKDIPDSIPTSR